MRVSVRQSFMWFVVRYQHGLRQLNVVGNGKKGGRHQVVFQFGVQAGQRWLVTILFRCPACLTRCSGSWYRGMRIDLVTDTYEPDVNGVAMTLGRLVKDLKARGHLVHVLRASERGSASMTGETVMPSLSLPIYHEVKIGLPSVDRFRSRWLRKRPDVVLPRKAPWARLRPRRRGRWKFPW